MNQTENISSKSDKGPLLEKEHGYFHSATVNLKPEHIYDFCQDLNNVKKALSDLPMDEEKFLDLTLESAEKTSQDEYRIAWQNKPGSKLSGTLTFLLTAAPAQRGTIVTAEASFDKFKFREETPSNLMLIFLRRMKALMETGEIATIKGQPSGREPIKTIH